MGTHVYLPMLLFCSCSVLKDPSWTGFCVVGLVKSLLWLGYACSWAAHDGGMYFIREKGVMTKLILVLGLDLCGGIA